MARESIRQVWERADVFVWHLTAMFRELACLGCYAVVVRRLSSADSFGHRCRSSWIQIQTRPWGMIHYGHYSKKPEGVIPALVYFTLGPRSALKYRD